MTEGLEVNGTENTELEDGVDADLDEELEDEDDWVNENLAWYVVHTYSGFENKARMALEERIKIDGLEPQFGEILVPVENVVELVRGNKRHTKRKFFPAYHPPRLVLPPRARLWRGNDAQRQRGPL